MADILRFHVESRIKHRYAKTIITSVVANNAEKAEEVLFKVTLPEAAFISAFQMEIDGKVYKAHVKEKEEAKQEYTAAVALGRSAAHVEQSVRDSNKFTVSVNVEKTKTITFKLTYEEVLRRELSAYKHVINIDPGQLVPELLVEVFIEESCRLSLLEVPPLQETDEMQLEPSTEVNRLAKIERPHPNEGVVRWSPSIEEQGKLGSNGVKGQLLVRYDVDRKANPEQILISNGYFVHFFAPSDLPVLRKHIVFVLDVSGSMQGRKIEQLKDAMIKILSDIGSNDYFSLITFSTNVEVWEPNVESLPQAGRHTFLVSPQQPAAVGQRDTMVVPATEKNVQKAKSFVSSLQDDSATNIHGALLKAVDIAHLGKKLHSIEKIPGPLPEPMIIFLTDGQPNVGESDPGTITSLTTRANQDAKASLFSLAFGDDADIEFLKKLSLQNSGFARKIYEAADASLQLNHFYRLVASPLLANVQFKYEDKEIVTGSVTKSTFRTLFNGSELMVAGRVCSNKISGEMHCDSCGSRKFSVTCKPPAPEAQKQEADHMERQWAFLTIKQLLDDVTADKDVASNKQRALELALKYSFVTPLTSLVVVKPDESTQAADIERADAARNNNMMLLGSRASAFQQSASFASSGPLFFGGGGTFNSAPQFGSAQAAYASSQLLLCSKKRKKRLVGGGCLPTSLSPASTHSSPALFGAPASSFPGSVMTAPAAPGTGAFSFGSFQSSLLNSDGSDSEECGFAVDLTKPDAVKCKVSSLRVETNVWCCYASTVVTLTFVNDDSTAGKTNFNLNLNSSAVISDCSMSENGKVKKLHLLQAIDGEQSFATSRNTDKAAVIVQPSIFGSHRQVLVSVPPQSTLSFWIQYEELLEDLGDGYMYNLNLNPVQAIPDFKVKVSIEGVYKLADVHALHVTPFTSSDQFLQQVDFSSSDDFKKADLKWSPDAGEQARLFGPDHTMKLRIKYKILKPSFELGGINGEVVLDESGRIIYEHLPDAATTWMLGAERIHVVLLLHVDCTATAESRQRVVEAANRLLLKLPHLNLFSIIVSSSTIQVLEDAGSDRFLPSQDNVTKARDFITQAVAAIPGRASSLEAAVRKALHVASGPADEVRSKILVLSAGGSSITEADGNALAAKLKAANVNKTAMFSLVCDGHGLLSLFSDICQDASGFACELHEQTVEKLLHLFLRVGLNRISYKIVKQPSIFNAYIRNICLRDAIDNSPGDGKLEQSLKHNIATSLTSYFAASE